MITDDPRKKSSIRVAAIRRHLCRLHGDVDALILVVVHVVGLERHAVPPDPLQLQLGASEPRDCANSRQCAIETVLNNTVYSSSDYARSCRAIKSETRAAADREAESAVRGRDPNGWSIGPF